MWDHVTLRATDLDASAAFYDTVLRTLGAERTSTADWLVEWDRFSLSPANAEKAATRGLHIGFTATTREHVHAFWQAGVAAGYRDDGAPGLRPSTTPTTTAASYSTPTATTSRPCSTTAERELRLGRDGSGLS